MTRRGPRVAPDRQKARAVLSQIIGGSPFPTEHADRDFDGPGSA